MVTRTARHALLGQRAAASSQKKNGFYGFELVTENERTAEFFLNILEENFGLSLTVSNGTLASFKISSAILVSPTLLAECASELMTNLAPVDAILLSSSAETCRFFVLISI